MKILNKDYNGLNLVYDAYLSSHSTFVRLKEMASTDPITLTRHILAAQSKVPEATGELTILMASIQLACKVISTAVRKAGISGLYGLEGSVNVQGEEVKKLDILSHDNL